MSTTTPTPTTTSWIPTWSEIKTWVKNKAIKEADKGIDKVYSTLAQSMINCQDPSTTLGGTTAAPIDVGKLGKGLRKIFEEFYGIDIFGPAGFCGTSGTDEVDNDKNSWLDNASTNAGSKILENLGKKVIEGKDGCDEADKLLNGNDWSLLDDVEFKYSTDFNKGTAVDWTATFTNGSETGTEVIIGIDVIRGNVGGGCQWTGSLDYNVNTESVIIGVNINF